MLPTRFALALCPLLGGLLLAACSSSTDDPAPAAPAASAHATLAYPVEQVGPFRVGYRTLTATYQPPAGGAARTTTLNLWYPTMDATGDPPRYAIFVDSDVLTDASLAPPADPTGYPVIVHSHGHLGFGGNSSDVMHYFASHGWVAIAPEHLGDTLPESSSYENSPAIYYLRSLDIKASLDTLASLPASDPLAGHCVTDRVFMSGHSRGTFTTWASSGAAFDMDQVRAMCSDGTTFSRPCTEDEIKVFAGGLGDPRIIAGMPMAGGVGDEPGWFGLTGYNQVKKPMMVLSGSDDPVGADRLWDRITGLDYTWVDFAGGCHQLFGLGGCPNLPEAEGFALVNAYALSFARHTLLGDTSPRVAAILGGESISARATFKHKSP